MQSKHPFAAYATTEYADALPREQFIDYHIKPLWSGIPRIAGPAFTVQLSAGDNLMLHAAIYEAPAGSILVVDAGDDSHAVAGGNVCAIAQKRGIAGMIIDGVIRDLSEIREAKFPVYARGHVAKPGVKENIAPLNQSIICGEVKVNANDIVVADEEGIAIIPYEQQEEAFSLAKKRTELDQATSLEEWEKAHHAKIISLLKRLS
ncbi:MAG: RraA family protein [Cocleimonas sp.]|nr:RraA family protein [Cocleimonas sp.]